MNVVIANLPVFWNAFLQTLALTLLSSAIALVIGTFLAAMRVSPVPVLRGFATTYVGVLRNTPAVIVLYFSVFVLPQVGVTGWSFFALCTVGISIYYGAFFCEAVRSGINAVPIGQAEAARSIGLNFTESLRYVVMPQALRQIVPPLINVFIAVTRTSAVAGAFGVAELFATMSRLANQNATAVIPILIATAVFFLLITIPAGAIAGRVEQRVRFAR
jgi:glutamate transport system permease protein